ncbi:hypothetical protein KSF73_03515 [Burkholderiaceae bacterium DAT-1]|nr:hypothetical protein [Burkholderiaceae bacterium DAT-1]
MALTYIWSGFFLIGILSASIQWMTGDADVFMRVVDGMFSSARMSVMDIALPLAGVMTFWLGMLNIAEKAGITEVLARLIAPFFARIFPDVPRDHPANAHMVMNFSANLLGLDNAATPFGLKAMDSLQSLNPEKDTASNAQIMFLVLHTSGLTLLPVAIMAQRAVMGAHDPSDIFIPCMIATYVATMTGLLAVAIKQRIRLLDPVLLGWIGGMTGAIAGLVWYLSQCLTRPELEQFSRVFANALLLGFIALFLLVGLWRRLNVYEAFIEGAKQGMQTALTIIPYLVGMLVAIGVMRNAGVLDGVVKGLNWLLGLMALPTDFTAAVPTALMKPLSGSGARALMIDTMQAHGPDSFVGRLACIFQGSADTTFYIVALYFGSVGIRKSRYAIGYGLLADLTGAIAAIAVAWLFFGTH